jgi:hypothetical protein
MSNPSGDYSFAGLGFTGLRFAQGGSQYFGYLYYPGGNTAVSGAAYTDATGVVTFSVAQSPAGIDDVNFIGNIIIDMSGNVTAMAGTWTGRGIITNAPVVAAALAEGAQAAPAIRRPGPIIPILQVHGSWAAFDRRDIIP